MPPTMNFISPIPKVAAVVVVTAKAMAVEVAVVTPPKVAAAEVVAASDYKSGFTMICELGHACACPDLYKMEFHI